MILTQCPACKTLFHLTSDEQQACGGTVRCGACGNVFQADIYRIAEPPVVVAAARRRRWPARTGVAILTLALGAQLTFWLRAPLARVAFLHPVVSAVCRQWRCGLPHPRAVRAFRFAHLQVVRGTRAGTLYIRAQLVNTASFSQSLPLLVVTLLGRHATVLVRRHYPPTIYLRTRRSRLAAHHAAVVFLHLQGPASATGYRLALYPRRG
ncbi:MAG: zinc-ribbon and DUF3426 domain-containing protein [Acidiferrobacter sp.]